jgi:hypothetical protein
MSKIFFNKKHADDYTTSLTMNLNKVFTLLITSSVLIGCSSTTYGSRQEAKIAADNWESEGKEVRVIFSIPTEEEYQKANEELKRQPCDQDDEVFVCGSSTLIRHIWFAQEKDKRQPLVQTRGCVEEKETNQFVCRSKDHNTDEVSGEDWKKGDFTYRYFRY